MREVARGVTALVWPAQCAGCGEVVDEGVAFCAECVLGLDQVGVGCARCGEPAERALSACGRCAVAPPAFAGAAALGRYGGPLGEAVLRLKHGRRLEVAGALAPLLAELVETRAELAACEVVVPVPLAAGRLARRGFDQAGELARALVRVLGRDHGRRLPVLAALARVRETPPQAGGPAERAANVRGAFALREALARARVSGVAGRAVLLVDDVMTTGATASACARVLRRAGARVVYALTVARAVASV